MRDRATRDPVVMAIVAKAHVARMMVDQGNLALFCADALRTMFDLQFHDEEGLNAAYRRASTLAEEIAADFYETQEDFYADISGDGER